MKIVALAGGIGGARFLLGLSALIQRSPTEVEVTVIGNTGDDIWVHGLRVCPDLDTVMYTLGGGIDTERGWGRADESFRAKEELAAYGVEPTWFGLGDRDIGTHLVRTSSLNAGYPLSSITAALCERWQPGVRLLPMTDERAETHVLVDDPENPGTTIALHFQEWWIRHRASLPASGFVVVGIEDARPAPGVLDAIAAADVILLPPSNPIVSIGTIVSVPGISDALRASDAAIVGVSPIIGGAPVRGMADACLTAVGVQTSASAVALRYGARAHGGILDAWLVDTTDTDAIAEVEQAGIRCRAVPLLMTDTEATAAIAAAALDLIGVSLTAG